MALAVFFLFFFADEVAVSEGRAVPLLDKGRPRVRLLDDPPETAEDFPPLLLPGADFLEGNPLPTGIVTMMNCIKSNSCKYAVMLFFVPKY